MAVSALLRTSAVVVAPGGAARCHVLIRNNSAVVDQFVFTVRGAPADWTEIKPAVANLMPRQEVSVELTFRPPRSHEVPAGEHPFALRIASREDPAGSVVQEGVVTVEPFTEVAAGVVPETSTARRIGRHTLALDNLGNHPVKVEVGAVDKDERLTFRHKPARLELPLGHTTFARVDARPRKYFWKGENVPLPFKIVVAVPDAQEIELDARLDQKALIPRRVFWLMSILFGLLMVLVIIVTLLLRQQPVSIAGPSPERPSSSAATTTTGSAASTTASSAPSSAPGTSRVAGGGGPSVSAPTGGRAVTGRFRIETRAYPNVGGGPQLFSYVVPAGVRYRVLSVVLRNPAADTGQLQIRHGSSVVGTVDLAAINRDGNDELTFVPDDPPLVGPGERITLAVVCTNRRDPCTPTGDFTAALVR
jgi:hypothetical protein